MSEKNITKSLMDAGMIPVFYHEDIETCKNVITACYKGGLRVFEYTNRGEKALENYPILKEFAAKNCEGMLFGIGSINNATQAASFIMLDADFIVSPFLDKDIASICDTNDIYWIPGCATLTEISTAEKHGADIIKIFPGNILGPGFVKAVKGPMPHLKLMPTGGVSPTKENLEAWFNAGVVCVGMGSNLLTKDAIAAPKTLEIQVRDTLHLINNIKK